MSLSEQESVESQEQSPESSASFHEQSEPVEQADVQASVEETSHSLQERDPPRPNPHRQVFEKFLNDLEQLADPESKLQFAIDFMESSLAQGGTPHFKSFWEARNICLQLFKENIPPALRVIFWARYNDLSKEARRLKEILDEQSAFAVEQIEIAVKALEEEIATFSEILEKMSRLTFNVSSIALEKTLPEYERIQQELNLLNAQASRINAMRKELIRTEMRVRQKNKFFQRLSAAGDQVFPRRKELIKEISQIFINDVDAFIEEHFSKKDLNDPLFALREEIKTLQNMAKELTLNTHSFTHTRMRLSECWDRIKNEDKERKKERSQQKAAFKQNFDEAMQKLQEFNEAYQAQQPSVSEATKQLDELVTYIRNMELGRDELRTLREAVQEARKPILEKIHAQEMERANQDQEKEKQRRHKIQEIKQEVDRLLRSSEALEPDAIMMQRDAILDSMERVLMSKVEKQEIERQLKSLRDLISEKKEKSLLALSEDDRQSLQQLKEILRQRKERRQEIKAQIEALRKAAGTSGLDFEQAMNVNAQVAEEKERLEKINQGIQEIEQKISRIAKQVR